MARSSIGVPYYPSFHLCQHMGFSSYIGLWSWSTTHPQSVHSNGAGFLCQPSSKSTLPVAGLQHMPMCQVIKFLLPCFDPNEWYMKNYLCRGNSNPQPLSRESSALTTRPRHPLVSLNPTIFLYPSPLHLNFREGPP